MSQQPAALYPPHYTIWYEHIAGMNPQLSQALEESLAAGAGLTDSEVARLHAQYVLALDTTAIERLEERFRLLLDEASNVTASVSEDASRFGHSLEEHTARLRRPMAHDLLRGVVEEILADTRRMCLVTSELSQQLARSAREVRTLTQRLEHAQGEALLDPLTGLRNRRGFSRAVQDLAGEGRGLDGAALLVLDIDHFKRINDDHGHLLGDRVLRAVAQILRAGAAHEGVSSRLGGEEFALLLPQLGTEAALKVAEQLRVAVTRLRLRKAAHEADVRNVTVSIGVASAEAGETLENLLERADAALYAAKRAGRNRVKLAGPAAGEGGSCGGREPAS